MQAKVLHLLWNMLIQKLLFSGQLLILNIITFKFML
jgi:hypothetical protein